jgi:hypothetical protein
LGAVRKHFFFEKKKQKTFTYFVQYAIRRGHLHATAFCHKTFINLQSGCHDRRLGSAAAALGFVAPTLSQESA